MREHALEVYQGETLIFYSDGKWLHPLLDLEQFLATRPYDPGALSIHDKIVGRAAALLIVRLGVRRVHADILSELGADALRHFHVAFDYDRLVPRIACQTEALLGDELDLERAHALILERARREAAPSP